MVRPAGACRSGLAGSTLTPRPRVCTRRGSASRIGRWLALIAAIAASPPNHHQVKVLERRGRPCDPGRVGGGHFKSGRSQSSCPVTCQPILTSADRLRTVGHVQNTRRTCLRGGRHGTHADADGRCHDSVRLGSAVEAGDLNLIRNPNVFKRRPPSVSAAVLRAVREDNGHRALAARRRCGHRDRLGLSINVTHRPRDRAKRRSASRHGDHWRGGCLRHVRNGGRGRSRWFEPNGGRLHRSRRDRDGFAVVGRLRRHERRHDSRRYLCRTYRSRGRRCRGLRRPWGTGGKGAARCNRWLSSGR